MKPLFVFDLDSTITKCELLPLIAQSVGLGEDMARLTEQAMQGEVPFAQSFSQRVELLRVVPLSRAQAIVAGAPLHGRIAAFLRENAGRCMIVTGNLDVWIGPLIHRLGMAGRCICSKALVRKGCLLGVESVLDKATACLSLPRPIVAIGDGSNDVGMLKAADVGIAFGGARRPCDELIAAADMLIEREDELVSLLKKLL